MLDSARFLLHAFLVLPPATRNLQQAHQLGSRATTKELTSPFANNDKRDTMSRVSIASQLNSLFVATTIIVAASTMVAPASEAMTGKVVEGPSNAEMLELTLKADEKILTDTGTLLYMSDGVSFDREFRGNNLNRLVQGGRLVANVFSNNNAQTPATVALAPQFPSRILPVQLEDHDNTIIGNVHSFLAAPYNIELDYERTSLEGPKLFNTIRMERVTGRGTVYLTGSGNILAKKVESGEKLKLYPGAWVAMTDGMKMDFVKGRSYLFAGSLLEVEGPGTIWIDTAPISRIINEIDERLPHHS